jgi:4-hydroxybenzoate polyprenyltransferase
MSTLVLAAPWRRRMAAWFAERFPLGSHGLLIAAFFSSNHFLAQALAAQSGPRGSGEPVGYDLRALGGALLLLCFFFHLRVFDEHKDYRSDCRHHPDRVLSRGLVSLRHLRWLGGLAIALELALAVALGPAALVATALALAFSLLMLAEFFLGRWLRARLPLYAALHMLVMPLLALIVFSVTTGRMPWAAPGWFLLYAWVGFFVGFNWEISRKIKAPAEERPGVASYTKVFGTYGAAWLVLLVRVVDTALVAAVGFHLGLGPWFPAVLVVLFLVCLAGFLRFRFATSPATARRMETYAAIYVVAFDLTLAAFLAARLFPGGLGVA